MIILSGKKEKEVAVYKKMEEISHHYTRIGTNQD